MGLRGIDTIEDLAKVKQVVVEAVRRDGVAVLNAEDKLVAEMAAATEGEVIYFSCDPKHKVVTAHLAAGGRCVLSNGTSIILASGTDESEWVDLVGLDRVGFTRGGHLSFQVQNALAAVGAAWALNVNPALISRALSTFVTDASTAPGRFNIMEVNGIEVILDYAHNPAAMSALAQAVSSLEPKRTVILLTLPGDRRNDDMAKTVSATTRFANHYVLYEPKYRRGRRPMEIPNVMAENLPLGTRFDSASDFAQGLRMAWEQIGPGERLVIIPESVDEALEALRQLEFEAADAEECRQQVLAEGVA